MLILTIFSCNTSTEVPKGSLTGTVSLEGLSDHSLISVALYDLAYLDTTIVRINNTYPHIGVIITQHTEFDHRLQSPVKYTETLADGSFEITKIPTGKYNLVAMKTDFGFKYLYEIEIEEGENEISQARCHPEFIEGRSEISSRNKDQRLKIKNLKSKSSQPFDLPDHRNLGEGGFSLVLLSRRSEAKTDDPENRSSDLTLFHETVISGNIQENITVLPDHHLIIDDDTVFVPNTSSLTIHPGAVIRINPGVDLTIQGNLLAQGEENNMFWITSNDCFSQDLIPNIQDQIAIYNSMQLSEWASISDDLINWGKWDYANTCLLNQVNNLYMQNGIFRDGNCGYQVVNVNESFSSNLLANSIDSEEYAGIYYYMTLSGYIQKNIAINCINGIKLKDECNVLIENSYLVNNIIGIKLMQFMGEIKNNILANNSFVDIAFMGNQENIEENFIVRKNLLLSNVAIQQIQQVNESYRYYGNLDINSNNFVNCEWFIVLNNYGLQNVFASNNYFDGFSSIDDLEARVIDNDDVIEYAEIIFLNTQTQLVVGAGIME